jgi:glutamyl-tRNA synthetase
MDKSWKPETPEIVRGWLQLAGGIDETGWKADSLKAQTTAYLEAAGLGFGKLALPLRIAITGGATGPDLFKMIGLIGKTETLARVNALLERV